MGGSVNKVIVIGHLGRDAEVKFTAGGQSVASFSLATTEQWRDKSGERQERTEWHKCVLWGKQAESLEQYLVKGKQIYCEGRLQTRKWQDKDGNDRYMTEIKVDRLTLLGSHGGERGARRAEDQRRGDDGIETSGPVGGGFGDDEFSDLG